MTGIEIKDILLQSLEEMKTGGNTMVADMVNHPPHYGGKIECIDALESATDGLPADEAICAANVIKYVWRYRRKNGAQDLAKAEWYLHRLMRNYGSKLENDG